MKKLTILLLAGLCTLALANTTLNGPSAYPADTRVVPGPTATGEPVYIHNSEVYDPSGNLIATNTVDAVNRDSLYWKSYYYSNMQRSDKSTSPTPVDRTPMAFLSQQDVVGMDPAGEYVYNVYGATMRKFSTTTGAYTQYSLSHSGNGACGTDGNYVFIPSGTTVYKYTTTGTYVNSTTIATSTNQYAFAVANDTVWVGDAGGVTYYGYACSRFNGGSISYDASWAVGGGTGGAAMNIAFDGTYYYWVMGGYGSNSFKRFYRNRTLYTNGMASIDARSVMCVAAPPKPLDVGVTSITNPPPTCSLATYIPAARVRNNGTAAQPVPFYVKYRATGPANYLDSVLCPALPAAAETTIYFAPWTIGLNGQYFVSCSTMSAADSVHSNDKALATVGAGLWKVLIAVADAAPAVVQQMLRDSGAFGAIDIFQANSMTLRRPDSLLAAGYKAIVTWSNNTYYPDGGVAFGDTLAKYMDLGGGVVMAVFADYASSYNIKGRFGTQYMPIPGNSNTYTSGTLGTFISGHPIMAGVDSVACSNYKSGATSILHPGVTTLVASWTGNQVECAALDTIGRRVAFLGFFPGGGAGSLSKRWCRQMVNAIKWVVEKGDVGVTSIQAPTGLIDSNQAVTPACSVYNYRNTALGGYTVRMKVGTSCNVTAVVGSHPANSTIYVTFPAYSAWQRGNLPITCSTEASGDLDPANDKATGAVNVQVRDVGAFDVMAPEGSLDSGSTITPACTLYNYGTTTESYDVRLKIGTQYDQTASVASHAPGGAVYLAFPDWLALERGLLVVTCSTELAADGGKTNDKYTGDVFVGVSDVGPTAILAPIGAIDSGTTADPQVTVHNFGNARTTCDVTFIIDDGYLQTITRTIEPGADSTFTFPTWTALTRNLRMTKCSTYYIRDVDPANDLLSDSIMVNVHDIGVAGIINPSPVIGPGPTNPRALLRNWGTIREPLFVSFAINSLIPYYDTLWLPDGLPPEADTTIEFAGWDADVGSYTASCSTWTAFDQVPANNVLTQYFEVATVNAGVVAITAPTGSVDTVATITPAARVRNLADGTISFTTYFWIDSIGGNVYIDSAPVTSLTPGSEATVTFTDWPLPHPIGTYTTRCSTALVGDGNPLDDQRLGTFIVRIGGGGGSDTGWSAKAEVPAGGKGKRVKDGGALAYQEETDETGYIYAFKGNGRYEFYQYNTETNAWLTKDSIPAIGSAGKKKAVKKGATLASADGRIYATKGNGTLEYWTYQPGADAYAWTEVAGVPAGAKTVKEGTGAATVNLDGTNYIYLLKGSSTTEFYRYNTLTNTWEAKAGAPLGTSGKAYKNGSTITWDGAKTIYAVKGSYNEFFAYSVDSDAWTAKTPVPFIGNAGKKKKLKDGAGLAWHNGYVYAMKGGNTREFWSWNADSDRWLQLTDVPLGGGRNVKGGGALVYAAIPNALYALKGNNTLEFLRYGFSASNSQLTANSPATQSSLFNHQSSIFNLSAAPNPFSTTTTIAYSLPRAGSISLRLYDITGKLVTTLTEGYHPAGRQAYSVERKALTSGIYLLRLETETATTTGKLIIE